MLELGFMPVVTTMLQGAVASWLMVSTKIFWVVFPWSIKKAVGKGRLSGWGEIVEVFH